MSRDSCKTVSVSDDKPASCNDTKRAVSRFPNCTFISFESGGYLMTGHGEEIKKASSDFVENI